MVDAQGSQVLRAEEMLRYQMHGVSRILGFESFGKRMFLCS